MTLIDNLELNMLAEENIIPKVDNNGIRFPLVWRVGRKDVSFSDIEILYKQAKRQAQEFGFKVEGM